MGRRYRNLGTLDGISVGPPKTETQCWASDFLSVMAKHGFLVWGPHGELNLSHPGRRPLLTGQTPRQGLLSGQGSCQGHKHSSDSPEFNSQGGR